MSEKEMLDQIYSSALMNPKTEIPQSRTTQKPNFFSNLFLPMVRNKEEIEGLADLIKHK